MGMGDDAFLSAASFLSSVSGHITAGKGTGFGGVA